MSTVFLDTVGLIALWDEADQWHAEAKQAYDRIKSSRFIGVTTDVILLECGNASARRPYRQHVTLLRNKLIAKGTARLFVRRPVEPCLGCI